MFPFHYSTTEFYPTLFGLKLLKLYIIIQLNAKATKENTSRSLASHLTCQKTFGGYIVMSPSHTYANRICGGKESIRNERRIQVENGTVQILCYPYKSTNLEVLFYCRIVIGNYLK